MMSPRTKVSSFIDYHISEKTDHVFKSYRHAKRHIIMAKIALALFCFVFGMLIGGTAVVLLSSAIAVLAPSFSILIAVFLSLVIGAGCYYELYDRGLGKTENLVNDAIESKVSIAEIEDVVATLINYYPNNYKYSNDVDWTKKEATIETLLNIVDM